MKDISSIQKKSLSVAELAQILGISRIAVFKRIKKGDISAIKVGRSYVIEAKEVSDILGHTLGNKARLEIDKAIQKTVREYGETLRLLGKE